MQNRDVSRTCSSVGPTQHVHSDELHGLETEGSLDNDRQDRQEPVGTNAVDQPGTSNGTGVLPVLESPSLSVRATTKSDYESGNDESNNQ